jgi:phosphoribosylaminoimidazole-succinocarboxamide synthase
MVSSGTPGLIFQEDQGLTSVFDVGPIPGFQSDEIARARTKQTACAFAWLERLGVTTHWHNHEWTEARNGLVVREAQVRDEPSLSGQVDADVIGLELLFRVRASEKFRGRVLRGEVVLPEDIWPSDQQLRAGDRLLRPFVEASTKWEKVDRYLTPEEASVHVALGQGTLIELYHWVSYVAGCLDKLYDLVQATLVDGKIEAALHRTSRKFVVIDGISLDELGVMYNDEHYGKNLLRDWYKENHADWYQALQKAQKEHRDESQYWPVYPPLDKELADKHVKHYTEMASMLESVVYISR